MRVSDASVLLSLFELHDIIIWPYVTCLATALDITSPPVNCVFSETTSPPPPLLVYNMCTKAAAAAVMSVFTVSVAWQKVTLASETHLSYWRVSLCHCHVSVGKKCPHPVQAAAPMWHAVHESVWKARSRNIYFLSCRSHLRPHEMKWKNTSWGKLHSALCLISSTVIAETRSHFFLHHLTEVTVLNVLCHCRSAGTERWTRNNMDGVNWW